MDSLAKVQIFVRQMDGVMTNLRKNRMERGN